MPAKVSPQKRTIASDGTNNGPSPKKPKLDSGKKLDSGNGVPEGHHLSIRFQTVGKSSYCFFQRKCGIPPGVARTLADLIRGLASLIYRLSWDLVVYIAYFATWSAAELQLWHILLPLVVRGFFIGIKGRGKNLLMHLRSIGRLANLTINVWVWDEMRDYAGTRTYQERPFFLSHLMAAYLASMVVEITLNDMLERMDATMIHLTGTDAEVAAKTKKIPQKYIHDALGIVDDSHVQELHFAIDTLQITIQVGVAITLFLRDFPRIQSTTTLVVLKVMMDIAASWQDYLQLKDGRQFWNWCLRLGVFIVSLAFAVELSYDSRLASWLVSIILSGVIIRGNSSRGQDVQESQSLHLMEVALVFLALVTESLGLLPRPILGCVIVCSAFCPAVFELSELVCDSEGMCKNYIDNDWRIRNIIRSDDNAEEKKIEPWKKSLKEMNVTLRDTCGECFRKCHVRVCRSRREEDTEDERPSQYKR